MSDDKDNGWEGVRHAAAGMFNVWVDGVELDFAKEAWGHLHAAGLAGGHSMLEITAARIRLLTIARVYLDFCALAWDELSEPALSELAENLEIDPVALGMLVPPSRRSLLDDASDSDELREMALFEATLGQKNKIFECLKAAYGDEVALYTRLWHTRSPKSEEDSEGDEFEVCDPNSDAFQYVSCGFIRD